MVANLDLPPVRIALYVALALFSFISLALTGARIHYTEHIPRGDPLNGGRDFYDPVVAELLFTSLVTFFWSIFVIFTIHRRGEHGFTSTFLFEIIVNAILWVFWFAGDIDASTIWGDISWCQQFQPCRILSAMLAFVWLSWIVLTINLVLTIMFVVVNSGAHEPLHGRWDPRSGTRSNRNSSFLPWARPVSTA